LPAFSGVRVKPMSAELGLRAMRTLELFLAPLTEVPAGFVVTLPKVVSVEQVRLFISALEELERARKWAPGTLRFEVMVEAAQGLVGEDGRALLPQLMSPRLRGAHFGAYDFTASLDIPASEQRLHHPSCDIARSQMQLAFSGTGVWLSDGATTQMPVPIHRGDALSETQRSENRAAVHAAWRLAAEDTTRSLSNGFSQGWDLHPGQLVSRYAAVYGFYARNLAEASRRLTNFVSKLGQASLVGTTFDDAATGQGLLNFFLRGLNCGALTEDELLATGLTREELASKSFAVIARNRRT
jgi:citrate lyase beta subunit